MDLFEQYVSRHTDPDETDIEQARLDRLEDLADQARKGE